MEPAVLVGWYLLQALHDCMLYYHMPCVVCFSNYSHKLLAKNNYYTYSPVMLFHQVLIFTSESTHIMTFEYNITCAI